MVDPSPSPSPINVTVSIPPDAALDNYTLALANYTRDLAIGTAVLAIFTVVLAVIGWRALQWQRREIEHAEGQLNLAREEFQAAQVAAWPELHAEVDSDRLSTEYGVTVDYVHGSQPAYDIEVVIRQSDLMFGGEVGVLTPMRPHSSQTFGPLPDRLDWPADVQQVPLADDEYQVTLTWTRTDGVQAHMSWLVRADGRTEWVSGSRELGRWPAQGN